MRKLLIATVALVSLASAANAAPVDAAIAAMLQANDTVQRALDLDVCQFDEDGKPNDSRGKLLADDATRYDRINESLVDAFIASSGTDSEVEKVRESFCEAVANR